MISDLISRISSLESSIDNISRDVSAKIDAITTTVTNIGIATIVLVIIAIAIMIIRTRPSPKE
jgi:hypothetical protein